MCCRCVFCNSCTLTREGCHDAINPPPPPTPCLPPAAGHLTKQGGGIKTWRKRYFVCDNGWVFYYKDMKDKEPRGVIDLAGCDIADVSVLKKKKYCMHIHHPGAQLFFFFFFFFFLLLLIVCPFSVKMSGGLRRLRCNVATLD